MNILMVYPQYPETFWSFKSILKYISKKSAFPPLGLLTVASLLPSDWNITLVDLNVRKLKDQQIAAADMVFIGAMLVQSDNAQEIINRCKEQGKVVVAGGPAFTVKPESFTGVDHYVLNEAEVTLPLFLADLAQGKAKPMYSSKERPSITATPIPAWHLVNFRDYATMAVQYSRGCPFNCEFCDIIVMNGRTPRTKTSNQFLTELHALYEAGWRGSLFVVDDNFIGNKRVVKEMLRDLISWQKDRRFPYMIMTEASTNLAEDQELMSLMSAANFHKVFLGIETPNTDSLKECGKYQNVTRDLVEAVRLIQGNGMQVMGGFIVGFDNDKETIFDTQVSFIQQVGVVTAMVGLLNALPQTRLWRRLQAEGRLLSDSSGENTDGSLNFLPIMGREKLIEGYKRILASIYSRKLYYRRIHTFLNHYVPTAKGRVSLSDIKALLRSAMRIGIFSRSRILYWKLMLRTLFTKARAFPMVVEMAICGLHFEKMTKRVLRAEAC